MKKALAASNSEAASAVFVWKRKWGLAFGAHGVGEEIGVGKADAVGELGAVGPTECGSFAYVKELARCAVRASGVPVYLAFVADNLGHKLRELLDRELLACPGIHGLVARVVVHKEHAEVGEVIYV